MTIFLYIIIGLLSGVLGGLGMGGGTLLIPLLSIFMGLDQKISQGINLMSFLLMAIFSLAIHYKSGFVKTKGVFLIIASGIIFSILGAIFASYIPSKVLRISFGIFLCFLSILQFLKAMKSPK